MGDYAVILADPPWQYRVYHESDDRDVRGLATRHYRTMPLAAIKALPVGDLAAPNCALFLWVTMPCLAEGLAVMQAWGFQFKTCAFTWVKTNKDGTPCTGTGHYTRANAELCLLGTRGRMRRRDSRAARSVSQVIVAPRRQHSRKPDAAYGRIELLFDAERRIELFGRHRRPGWDLAYADEPDKFDTEDTAA